VTSVTVGTVAGLRGVAGTVRAALALLTRLPVGVPDGDVGSGAAAFPLVGGLVGLVSAAVLLAISGAEATIAAIAAVAVGVVLTGALHLDGLADTADAMAAPDPVRAEAARRDPSSGPAGVVALVLVIGAEVAAVASLVAADAPRTAAAVVACAAVARLVPVVAVVLVRDARGQGFGAWFAHSVRPADALVAVLLTAAIVAGASIVAATGIVAVGAAAGGLIGVGVTVGLVRARGGLDGDGLGAGVVLAGMAGLVSTALLS
jgi:adenosylcobinamide-GDP ribazoletransferase